MTDTATMAPNRVWVSWNVGEKYGNGTSLFVGGSNSDEFLENLSEFLDDEGLKDFVNTWSDWVSDTLPNSRALDNAVTNLRAGGLIDDSPVPGETRQCKHGAMTQRSGRSSKGPWSGWFCPLRKGDPDQCKPIFA